MPVLVPVLGYMVGELEAVSNNCTDTSNMPRGFSITLIPSLRLKCILINCKSRATVTKPTAGTTYEENAPQFYTTFNFRKLEFER